VERSTQEAEVCEIESALQVKLPKVDCAFPPLFISVCRKIRDGPSYGPHFFVFSSQLFVAEQVNRCYGTVY
jgi:hypothetical protein